MWYSITILLTAFLASAVNAQKEVRPLKELSGTISKDRFSTFVAPGLENLEMFWWADQTSTIYISFPFPELKSGEVCLVMNVPKANWPESHYFKIIVEQIAFPAFPKALFAPSVPIPSDSIRTIVENIQNQTGKVIGGLTLSSSDSIGVDSTIRIALNPERTKNNILQFRIAHEQILKDLSGPYGLGFYYFKFSSLKLARGLHEQGGTKSQDNTWGQIKYLQK